MQEGEGPKTAENSRFEFETQASRFDARAHLGADAACAIADAVLRVARHAPDDIVLEIGAGTGEIGVELARRTSRYVGLDASGAMLDVFAARGHVREEMLRVADANTTWPVDAASVSVVFMSRVAHLLDRDHVLRELRRVRRETFTLVVGRRRRSPESPWRLASAQARALLEARGYAPKRGDRAGRGLVAALEAEGAHASPVEVVFTRRASASLRTVLDAWRDKGGLAGLDLPGAVKDEIIGEVERALVAVHGALDAEVAYEERFVLDVARFSP